MNSLPFSKLKQLFCTCLFFSGMIVLTGCWSATEINDLAIIDVLGIDLNEGGEFEVTASIIKPKNVFVETLNRESEGGGQGAKALVATATGESLFEAMNNLSKTLSKRVYLGHVNNVIFGELAATQKMDVALDFFKRQNDFRPSLLLFVTKGVAKDILMVSPELEPTLGLEIHNILSANRFSTSNMVKDLSQFHKALSSNTTDPVTGVISPARDMGIKVEGEEPSKKTKDEKGQENQASGTFNLLGLDGTAVFKDGKLRGYLNDQETRGLLWLKGEKYLGINALNCATAGENGKVSLIVRKAESRITPHIEDDDSVHFTVDIFAEADIGEITCRKLDLTTKTMEQLNKQYERLIREDIKNVLQKTQKQWQTDIVGFGEIIYRKEPKRWAEISDRWRDELFKETPITIKVTANINKYGLTKDPNINNESR
jgi:spore germination protein KC